MLPPRFFLLATVALSGVLVGAVPTSQNHGHGHSLLRNGQSCNTSNQCQSLYCHYGSCDDKKANGYKCYKNEGCLSGRCDHKKCRPVPGHAVPAPAKGTTTISTPVKTATTVATTKPCTTKSVATTATTAKSSTSTPIVTSDTTAPTSADGTTRTTATTGTTDTGGTIVITATTVTTATTSTIPSETSKSTDTTSESSTLTSDTTTVTTATSATTTMATGSTPNTSPTPVNPTNKIGLLQFRGKTPGTPDPSPPESVTPKYLSADGSTFHQTAFPSSLTSLWEVDVAGNLGPLATAGVLAYDGTSYFINYNPAPPSTVYPVKCALGEDIPDIPGYQGETLLHCSTTKDGVTYTKMYVCNSGLITSDYSACTPSDDALHAEIFQLFIGE